MNKLIQTIQNLDTSFGRYFENGMINAAVYCFFMSIIAFVLYKLVKHIIIRKNADNKQPIIYIWKTFVICILVYSIATQFKPIQSLTKTLVASSGIIALVLSLAAQETISNIMAGILIVFSKPFCVGDLIKINNGEYIGHVEEITLRHTIIKSYENNRITIPNSIVNKSSIENANLKEDKKLNFLEISIDYTSDIDKAMEIIQRLSENHQLCHDGRTKAEKNKGFPKVPVKIIAFEDSGIRLRASIYSKDSAKGFLMLSDLRYQIKKEFDKEGVEMPYPHVMIVYKDNQNSAQQKDMV